VSDHRIAPDDPIEAGMGDGTVLLRDKVVARNLALVCLLMFLVFGAASIAYLRGWRADANAIFRWLAYFFVPFSAWVGLTKTVLRTVVTTQEVQAQQGLRALHVPVASISQCRIFHPGVERGLELYSPAGGGGVVVEWRDAKGKERKTLIGSDDPSTLAAGIERARAAARHPTRVAADVAEPSDAGHEGDEAPPESKRIER